MTKVPVKKKLTDFFPGIAHSQLIRFRLPSAFLTGLATKPYEQSQSHLKTEPLIKGQATSHEEKIVLTKGWSFRHAFLSSANLAMAIPDIIHLKWNKR